MKTPFKKNNALTGIQYKELSLEKLIELFTPLIKALGRAYGEHRFNEDVEQQVTIELLKRLKLFDETIGIPFLYYVHMYMKALAKNARLINIAAVYVPFSSMEYLKKRDKYNEKLVISLDESKEKSTSETFNNSALIYEDEKYVEPILSYTTMKIILKALKDSKYSKFKKNNIKKYIHESLKTGKINLNYNNILRNLLENTELANYFK